MSITSRAARRGRTKCFSSFSSSAWCDYCWEFWVLYSLIVVVGRCLSIGRLWRIIHKFTKNSNSPSINRQRVLEFQHFGSISQHNNRLECLRWLIQYLCDVIVKLTVSLAIRKSITSELGISAFKYSQLLSVLGNISFARKTLRNVVYFDIFHFSCSCRWKISIFTIFSPPTSTSSGKTFSILSNNIEKNTREHETFCCNLTR